MKIEANVILDSVNRLGKRITTLQLEYPRYIHAEFMTHRVFTRNAGSSRAIPVRKMVARTLENMAFFLHVGKNQKGMKAKEEVDLSVRYQFEREWNQLGQLVADHVLRWSEQYGIHKQVANRALEPWQHIVVVCTATEWENFFSVRNHKDAMPEMQALARQMLTVMNDSEPEYLRDGEWHLPFVRDAERATLLTDQLLRVSTARCARTSYLNHDGEQATLEDEDRLYGDLLLADPMHPSPFEHQAIASSAPEDMQSRNFSGGWVQQRELIEKLSKRYGIDGLKKAMAGMLSITEQFR